MEKQELVEGADRIQQVAVEAYEAVRGRSSRSDQATNDGVGEDEVASK